MKENHLKQYALTNALKYVLLTILFVILVHFAKSEFFLFVMHTTVVAFIFIYTELAKVTNEPLTFETVTRIVFLPLNYLIWLFFILFFICQVMRFTWNKSIKILQVVEEYFFKRNINKNDKKAFNKTLLAMNRMKTIDELDHVLSCALTSWPQLKNQILSTYNARKTWLIQIK
jgi:hypothetical protein